MRKFTIFVLLVSFSILSATTYFVKTVADGGSNSNSGLSWQNAKAMIEPAVESSAAGDTILVKYGTYLFTAYANKIEITSNRKIISDDGDGTGWNDAEPDSSLCIIDANEHCNLFYISGNSVTNETRIKGFKITNGKDSHNGGGIYVYNADPIIENCWITENVIIGMEDGYGGGIYCKNSNAIIQNNVISGNIGNTNGIMGLAYGGGIYCYNSDAIIRNNVISGNIGSTESSTRGCGGGIYCYDSNAIIRNNVISGNVGSSDYRGFGGGIYCTNSDATISYNVFYENADDTTTRTGEGSGIYRDGGSPEIKNNIFMNHNIANSDKRAIYSTQTGFNVSYNCYYNNSVANHNITSTNSVEADPKFTDAGNGDFSLTYESPCIDAGETSYSYNEIENHHKGWKTDIGAFEYTGNRIKKEVTEIGELLFGGNVRAKVNVTNLNTLTAIDITVHPAEAPSGAPDGVQRWFDITPTGEVGGFDITLSYKDTELNDNYENFLNLFRWDGDAWEGPKPADVLDSTQNLLLVNNETAFSQWMIKQNLPDVDEFPGNCLEFDGIDDYVDLVEPENLKLQNFTIATWFKRTGDGITAATGSGGLTAEPLVTKGRAELDGSNVDMNYFLGIEPITKVIVADFEDMNSGANHPILGVTEIENDTWYYATATYDETTWRLYLNGNIEVESEESATPRYDSIQDNAIGSALNSSGIPSGYFKGFIDEVSIWDTALDSIQVREQMHLNLCGLETGLVSYWQFNEDLGGILYDALYTNNGELTNMDTLNCWIDSTIPFGSGVTDTQTETAGTVDFTDTGLSMYFNSQTSAEITVTRIDTIPNVNLIEPNEVFDAQYWVVNRFGTGNFEADITFALNEDLTSEDEAAPVQIKLYTRSTTADDSWIYLCNANSVNAANNEVTFNGISTFSQFIIARQIPQVDVFSGNCLEFDGFDDYVTLGNSASLKPIDELSIEMWVYSDNWSSIPLTRFICNTQTGGYNIGTNASFDIYTAIRYNNSYHTLTYPTTELAEGWHQITVTFDGQYHKLHIDGYLRNESNAGSNYQIEYNSSNHTLLGAEAGSGSAPTGSYFTGKIEEVRIWNTALDSLQIREQIHLNLSGLETGLVSYWQFNEESGTVLEDKISGNDGTLNNMADIDWIDSTIPFGDGFCDTKILTTTGFYDFNDADFRITLNSEAAGDIVVVSKINLSPNIIPEDIEEVLDDQYWIMHQYGNTDLDLLDVVFKNVSGITEDDISEPSRIKLYRRASNSDSDWIAYDTCINVQINGNLNEVIFENITEYGQFIIARTALQYLDIPQNVSIEIIDSNVEISWEEVTGASSYKIFASSDPNGTFTEDNSGTFTDESWSALLPNGKMFYYVIASSDAVRDNVPRLSKPSKIIYKQAITPESRRLNLKRKSKSDRQ